MPEKCLLTLLVPLLLTLPLLAACAGGGPETAEATAPATPSPVDEAARVRQALDDFFAAAEAKDWARLDELVAADFEFYSDDTLILSRQEFLDAMQDDSMEIGSLELDNVQVMLSDDGRMALVKYSAALESTIAGEAYNMESAETVVFRKEGESWRLIHNHASIREL